MSLASYSQSLCCKCSGHDVWFGRRLSSLCHHRHLPPPRCTVFSMALYLPHTLSLTLFFKLLAEVKHLLTILTARKNQRVRGLASASYHHRWTDSWLWFVETLANQLTPLAPLIMLNPAFLFFSQNALWATHLW